MKKLTTVLLAGLALGACKKDNSDSPAQTRTDLLTAHNWKPSSGTYSFAGIGGNLFQTCDKDDAYKFNTDKSVVVDAGTTKCNTSDPQKQTGTWALSSDEQKLTINVTGSLINGEADIKELSATTLHITGTQMLNGVPITADATFVAY